MINIRFVPNRDAVSEVVSAIMVLLIVTSTISGILLWGIPYIEDIKTNALQEDVISKFNAALTSIEEMAHDKSDIGGKYEMSASEGNVHIDPVGDRLIVMYSLDPDYNFTVDGLGNDDPSFTVNLTGGNGVTNAEVYWFDGDPSVNLTACEDISFIDKTGNSCAYIKFDIRPLYKTKIMEKNDMRILSVKLRLIPSRNANLYGSMDREIVVSHIQDQLWNEKWSYNRIWMTSTDETKKIVFSDSSEYIESTDILELFLRDYSLKKTFFSIKIEDINYLVDKPVFSIDGHLLFVGKTSNHMSFYSHEKKKYEPKLIIEYAKSTKETKDQNGNKIEKQNIYKNCHNNIIRYTCNNPRAIIFTYEKNRISNITYDFKLETPLYRAYFRNISSPSERYPVSVARNGYLISYSPAEYLMYVNHSSSQNIMTKNKSEAVIQNNMVTYYDQYGPGIDLRYTAFSNMLKEELIIKNRSIIPSLPSNMSDEINLALVHHVYA